MDENINIRNCNHCKELNEKKSVDVSVEVRKISIRK